MQPEKHIADLKSSSRRRKFLQLVGSFSFFLTSVFLAGPLIHEASHIAVLEMINCTYGFDYGFQFLRGLYGSVDPYCQASNSILLLFYSAGYLTTILLGGVLSAVSMRTDGKSLSIFTASIGTGLLISVLISVGSKGDISQAISVLEIGEIYGTLAIVFIITGIFVTSLRTIEHIFRLERKE
jgi:hypothetical protein